MRTLILVLLVPLFGYSQFTEQEIKLFKAEAQRVTIIRDTWGVPHVYGRSDADAVFGLLYAQCEENFQKVEENTLELLGRMAEVKGGSFLFQDLQIKLIYDTAAAIEDYKTAPPWFKKLLNAYADGINYFLYKHPEVKPSVLNRFQPWYALMRTNGSISATQTGGITIQDMRNLYKMDSNAATFNQHPLPFFDVDAVGSNGFAVAPSKTRSRNAIIYINPHVTFYYRSEMQMVSDEALNAYGGVTWGTFFIFQGFNEHCGWMHTTSAADVADLYEEKVQKEKENYSYRYNGIDYPVKTKNIRLRYKQNNAFNEVSVTGYYTNHGPVMGMRNGKWLSLKENNRSLTALMQSWLRTKSDGFEAFKKIMDLRSNSSDNTVFADDKGNIAYWHGNFIPKRDSGFDFNLPVDGTITATDWKGLHTLDEMIHVYNPATGWIQNCNSTPFTVSGSSSPKKENYPVYMAPDAENYRAINAERLLDKAEDLTIDKMIKEIGYSHYLAAFAVSLPPLFKVYDGLSDTNSLKRDLSEPIEILRSWNKYSSESSVATTLAIEWASRPMANLTATEKLGSLAGVKKDLETKFGSWKIPWGDINRYQRVGDGEKFDDNKPSLPVGLASSQWGSLPSFASRRTESGKRYGYNGNSFIACVEFGKRLKAKSIITGGQSFDPSSKHFTDQAKMYIDGNFKDVLFYKEDVLKHVERRYHPGE
jgi:acyl-homoserine lactone acylase PvdQ